MRSHIRLYFWLHVPGLIEGEPEVVAVVGFLDPALGKLAGQLEILVGLGLFPAHFAKLRERAQAADGLGAEVDVVREVPGEIVGAKLVLRIKAFVLQILRPLFELLPVEPGEIGVAFHLRPRPP